MYKVILCSLLLLSIAGVAAGGIIDPCRSSAVFNGSAPECYFACPDGDAESFVQAGFSFSLRIVDWVGNPIANIPKADFWVIDCDPARNLVLCAGSASSNADSSTNPLGRTTMGLTTLAAGGCANGLSLVCQGVVFGAGIPSPCQTPCFDIRVRSADQNGDLIVNLTDLATFATRYPPMAYNECADFNCDGRVSLGDLSRFAAHYNHTCN